MSATPVMPSEPPKPGALLRLFAKVEQDPIEVHEALEEIRDSSGENIRKDIEGLQAMVDVRFQEQGVKTDARFKEQGAKTDARFDVTDARIDELKATVDARFQEQEAKTNTRFDALQREFSLLRWTIWIGSAAVGIALAVLTFLRG